MEQTEQKKTPLAVSRQDLLVVVYIQAGPSEKPEIYSTVNVHVVDLIQTVKFGTRLPSALAKTSPVVLWSL